MATKIYQPQNSGEVKTITNSAHRSMRQDIDKFEKWRNGRSSYHIDDVPLELRHVDNRMRSQVEQYEFKHSKPDRYFAYWSKQTVSNDDAYQIWLTTWVGDRIAKVSIGYNEWQDNFGGTRVSFQCRGINGIWYHGTYFKSAGDYARIYKLKYNPFTGEKQ